MNNSQISLHKSGSSNGDELLRNLPVEIVPPVSRRQFIFGSGIAFIGGYLSLIAARTSPLSIIDALPQFSIVLDAESNLADAVAARASEKVRIFGNIALPEDGIEILRFEDLLAINFKFENLTLVSKGGGWFGGERSFTLVPTNPRVPSYIIAEFPPQHVLEKCYYQAQAGSDTPQPAPVENLFSGGSRLAFRLPRDVRSIPFDIENLFNWNRLEPSVVPAAVANGEMANAGPVSPSPLETSIEFPYRLFLSTHDRSAWIHSGFHYSASSGCVTAVDSESAKLNGAYWKELWHTRLASQPSPGVISDDNDFFRTLRAVWCREMDGETEPPDDCLPKKKDLDGEFLASMDKRDRFEIVKLTSRFSGFEEMPEKDKWIPYRPRPIQINKLLLTSQGATINSDAKWPIVREIGGRKLNVREWHHESALGRDQYVRVVYGGYLFPYGHPCTMIQITERRFQKPGDSPGPSDPITAYLRQEITIAIEVPVKESGSSGMTDGEFSIDRKMPIKRITITTDVTPPLDPPDYSAIPVPGVPKGICAFWPRVGRKNFLFHLLKKDVDGHTSECLSPAIFVVQSRSDDEGTLSAVQAAWQSSGAGWCDLNNQKIAFVPSTGTVDSKLQTAQLNFDAFVPTLALKASSKSSSRAKRTALEINACELPKPEPPAPWEPVIQGAKVKIPAVEQIVGNNNPVEIGWDPGYLAKGFDLDIPQPNVGELFARLIDSLPFSLPNSKSVSLIKPEFGLKGLSRKFGPIGGTDLGLDCFSTGTLNVRDLLSGVRAKILGALDLIDVLKELIPFDVNGGGGRIPNTNTRIINDENGLPLAAESSTKWYPELKNFPGEIVQFIRADNSTLELEVVVRSWIREGGAITYSLKGHLSDFHILIVKAIDVHFDRFTFIAASGQKPSVDVDIRKVTFGGALAFVNKLQEFLSKSPFGDQGPSIFLTPSDVTISAGFGLPNVAFGVFSLQNIRFSSRLLLPLKGDTPIRLRIAFAERNNPFLLSVTFLGGGGFVAVSLGLDGIESVEVALEFGGIVSLSLGVAEGNAYILAGIYVLYRKGGGTLLSGYVRCGGALTIIGIVTVSIEVYLGLAYDSANGRVWGTAEVTVEISIAFFSIEVSFRIEREFAGGKGNSRLNGQSTRVLSTDTGNADDPRLIPFSEQVSFTAWRSYWRAFDLSL